MHFFFCLFCDAALGGRKSFKELHFESPQGGKIHRKYFFGDPGDELILQKRMSPKSDSTLIHLCRESVSSHKVSCKSEFLLIHPSIHPSPRAQTRFQAIFAPTHQSTSWLVTETTAPPKTRPTTRYFGRKKRWDERQAVPKLLRVTKLS